MFCDKCGLKLNSDSLFCPKCGVRINTAIEDYHTENEIVPTEDANSDIKENKYAFSERIESVDDREENDALFHLYECFIDPLKKLEYTENQLTVFRKEFRKNSEGYRPKHFPLKSAFIISFFYAIFGIVGVIRKWELTDKKILRILWAPIKWIETSHMMNPLRNHVHSLLEDVHIVRAFLLMFITYMLMIKIALNQFMFILNQLQ